MTRILAQAVHYPHAEHRDALIAAMRALIESAADTPGLDEIGAFSDGERVVAISVWQSAADMQAGMAQLFGAVGRCPSTYGRAGRAR